MYTFYVDEKQFTKKPTKKEVADINTRFQEVTSDYQTIARGIGEMGMTFAVASFYHKRTNDDFKQEQLFALDFDSGITFEEIKARSDYYHLPILFAYKTFSWKPEHEKFRIVIGFSHVVKDLFTAQVVILILMELFPECDKACKDPARMFYGGKGLLYLNDYDEQLSPEQLLLSLDEYMRNQYGQKHYTEHLKKFYQKYRIATDKNGRIPVIAMNEEAGQNVFMMKSETVHRQYQANNSSYNENIEKRRSVVKNFDWKALYSCCELFRNFYDGKEYYYYPELFHIALNLCCVDGGRKKFIEILNAESNQDYDAYFERDWKNTLNDIVKHEYLPKNCNSCPYAETCHHGTNMISTANPSSHDVRVINRKQYYTIEEAEESLAENFQSALLDADPYKIKIITAQTGIGKTHLYLNMLLNTQEPFMIVVPSHDLAEEIYTRAVSAGVKNILAAPRQPELSAENQAIINHYYHVGAGEFAVQEYREMLQTLYKNDSDYYKIKFYLDKVDEVLHFSGHIIITHQRFLYLSQTGETLMNHRVIIDEDILSSVFAVQSVDKSEVQKMMQVSFVKSDYRILHRLKSIYYSKGMIKFDYGITPYLEKEIISDMRDIDGNVLGLLSATEILIDGKSVSYLKYKPLPYKEMIIMSATANPELYRMLMPDRKIEVYHCKEARYKGKIIQYTDQTYSRGCLERNPDIVKKLTEETRDYDVITFNEIQHQFRTTYHFGGVEGLDILKGKNLCIIGMPNITDTAYRLYGMRAGISESEMQLRKLRVQHNDYDFSLYTYENKKMQMIQIWFIESLLEQAVGRARLLRYDCEVKVYSGFPVSQAEFIES